MPGRRFTCFFHGEVTSQCLVRDGAASPREVGKKLGVSFSEEKNDMAVSQRLQLQ